MSTDASPALVPKQPQPQVFQMPPGWSYVQPTAMVTAHPQIIQAPLLALPSAPGRGSGDDSDTEQESETEDEIVPGMAAGMAALPPGMAALPPGVVAGLPPGMALPMGTTSIAAPGMMIAAPGQQVMSLPPGVLIQPAPVQQHAASIPVHQPAAGSAGFATAPGAAPALMQHSVGQLIPAVDSNGNVLHYVKILPNGDMEVVPKDPSEQKTDSTTTSDTKEPESSTGAAPQAKNAQANDVDDDEGSEDLEDEDDYEALVEVGDDQGEIDESVKKLTQFPRRHNDALPFALLKCAKVLRANPFHDPKKQGSKRKVQWRQAVAMARSEMPKFDKKNYNITTLSEGRSLLKEADRKDGGDDGKDGECEGSIFPWASKDLHTVMNEVSVITDPMAMAGDEEKGRMSMAEQIAKVHPVVYFRRLKGGALTDKLHQLMVLLKQKNDPPLWVHAMWRTLSKAERQQVQSQLPDLARWFPRADGKPVTAPAPSSSNSTTNAAAAGTGAAPGSSGASAGSSGAAGTGALTNVAKRPRTSSPGKKMKKAKVSNSPPLVVAGGSPVSAMDALTSKLQSKLQRNVQVQDTSRRTLENLLNQKKGRINIPQNNQLLCNNIPQQQSNNMPQLRSSSSSSSNNIIPPTANNATTNSNNIHQQQQPLQQATSTSSHQQPNISSQPNNGPNSNNGPNAATSNNSVDPFGITALRVCNLPTHSKAVDLGQAFQGYNVLGVNIKSSKKTKKYVGFVRLSTREQANKALQDTIKFQDITLKLTIDDQQTQIAQQQKSTSTSSNNTAAGQQQSLQTSGTGQQQAPGTTTGRNSNIQQGSGTQQVSGQASAFDLDKTVLKVWVPRISFNRDVLALQMSRLKMSSEHFREWANWIPRVLQELGNHTGKPLVNALVDLSHNDLTDFNLKSVLQVFTNANVHIGDLNLNDNKLTDSCIPDLANYITQFDKPISVLSLEGNRFSTNAMLYLVRQIKLSGSYPRYDAVRNLYYSLHLPCGRQNPPMDVNSLFAQLVANDCTYCQNEESAKSTFQVPMLYLPGLGGSKGGPKGVPCNNMRNSSQFNNTSQFNISGNNPDNFSGFGTMFNRYPGGGMNNSGNGGGFNNRSVGLGGNRVVNLNNRALNSRLAMMGGKF